MERTKILERLVKFFGKTKAEIERELALSNGTLYRLEKGLVENPKSLTMALQQRGLNPAYFLTGEGEPELEKKGASPLADFKKLLIPFLSQKASAGNGVELMPGDEVIRYISIPDNIAQIKGLYALKVAGDSMYPTLSDGDIVVCDSNGWSGDGIYVIRTSDSEFVKRVVLTPQGYQVISDNNLYPPYACRTEDAEMIGRVRCAVIKV